VHRFLNFKSFEDASLDLYDRPFTVLIGKNGSGKSNAIEGVELLAQIAHGRPLHEITDIGRGTGNFQLRGGLQACPRAGKTAFGLEFSVSFPDAEGAQSKVTYEVVVEPLPEPHIQRERLQVQGEPADFEAQFQSKGPNAGLLSVNHFGISGSLENKVLTADRSVLARYELLLEALVEPSNSGKLASYLNLANAIQEYLRSSFVFDPQPKLMRAYERVGNRVLARDGANISAVLYALRNGSEEEQQTLARILARLQQLPEEPFQDFDFVVTALNDVLFGIRETKDGPLVDARLLSDGTLRCLAVLAALETAKSGSRVVIEEFDNGLHPSRVNVLTQAIAEVCQRRGLNVLCTTHNPATLDGLTREQLEGVVLCFWDRARKSSRLIPLMEMPRADVLLERGQLGDLITRRVLEQHLVPGFEDDQKAKAQEWLDSLP